MASSQGANQRWSIDYIAIGCAGLCGNSPGSVDPGQGNGFIVKGERVQSSVPDRVTLLKSFNADGSEAPRAILSLQSPSPADNDTLASLVFQRHNDALEVVNFARLVPTITDASDGTEESHLSVTLPSADNSGVQREGLRVHPFGISLMDGAPEPTAVSGRAIIYIDSADGDLKIRFGDGTIKTIVADS